MWTSDLLPVASTSQPQKHKICDFPADASLSPYSECSSRSESPFPVDPVSPISSRSIFKSYWSTSESVRGDDEQSPKLSSLRMPLVTVHDEFDSQDRVANEDHHASSEGSADKDHSSKLCISTDDSSISYSLPPTDRSKTQRRQILPTPPKSIVKPESPCMKSCCRPWSSTSSLIKKPTNSCLRPSRYSFSGSNCLASLNEVDTKGVISSQNVHLKKEVSFYAQVSVLEFTVPQEQRSDGWSKYFV